MVPARATKHFKSPWHNAHLLGVHARYRRLGGDKTLVWPRLGHWLSVKVYISTYLYLYLYRPCSPSPSRHLASLCSVHLLPPSCRDAISAVQCCLMNLNLRFICYFCYYRCQTSMFILCIWLRPIMPLTKVKIMIIITIILITINLKRK